MDADGALSGKGVGTCRVQARFSGDDTKAASAWVTSPAIAVAKGTHPAPRVNPYGSGATVAVDATLAFETTPVGYGGATYSVTSGSAVHCEVDTAGTITGLTAGNCTVQVAFAGDANYGALAVTDLQTVSVVGGLQTLASGETYGSSPTVAVGETLAVAEGPVGSRGGDIGWQAKAGSEAFCSVDGNTGAVTGVAVGSCEVQARALATSDGNGAASAWADVGTIAVEIGTLTGIQWHPGYPRSYVGIPRTLHPLDVGDMGGGVIYLVKDAGETGCAFENVDENDPTRERTLNFTGRGRCVVTARLERSGYLPWEQDFAIDVDLSQLRLGSDLWGSFVGQRLTVAGPAITPRRGGGGPGAVAVAVDYSGSDAQGMCPELDGQCPEVTRLVDSTGLDITYALLRGERDCRLNNYRTGSVSALPVPIRKVQQNAGRTFTRSVRLNALRFVAKTAGSAGDDITVTIEDGTNSDKKYTVTDGVTTETYDDTALGDLEAALASSALVDVTVYIGGEPSNKAATNLSGGGDGVQASGVFTRLGLEGVLEFSALAAGEEGNSITVTIENGTNSDKKYTVTNGTITEVYDDVAVADVATEMAASALVGVVILDPNNGPDNVAAMALLGGGGVVANKCSLIGTARKAGYRLAKSHPIEVALEPGVLPLASLPRYLGMRINPDNSVQLPIGEVLALEEHPQVKLSKKIDVNYVVQGYGVGTTDFADSSNHKADVCTVEGDASASGFGNIGAGSAADSVVAGDICRLTFSLRDPLGTYESFESSVNFVVASKNLTFDTAPTLSYGDGAKLKIGVTTPLEPAALPGEDDSTPAVAVVWKYETTGVCTVDSRLQISDPNSPIMVEVDHDNNPNTDPIEVPSGRFEMMANPDYGHVVLGESATNGDVCGIKAYATAAGYRWYEGVSVVEFIVDGLDLLLTEDGAVPVYPDELRLTGEAAPDRIVTQDDNGVEVAWGGWRVEGTDVDSSDANGEVCTVDPATGVVSLGSAATAGDTCRLYGSSGAATEENYDAEEFLLAEYTIGGTATFTAVTAPVYDEDGLTVGRTEPLPFTTAPTTTPANAGVMWDYVAGGKRAGTPTEDICTIDGEGSISLGSDAQPGDTCEVTVTALGNGYEDAAASAPVVLTVKGVFTAFSWPSLPDERPVDAPLVLSGPGDAPVVVPATDANGTAATVTVAVAAGSTGTCAWNDSSRTISFTLFGVCYLEMTARLPNYVEVTETVHIVVTGASFPLAGATEAEKWGTLPATIAVARNEVGAVPMPLTSAGLPSTIEQNYRSLTPRTCHVRVYDSVHHVRGLDGGTCRIEAQLIGNAKYYDFFAYIYTTEVVNSPAGTATWGSFTGVLNVGGGSKIPSRTVVENVGNYSATTSYTLKSGSEAYCELLNPATGKVRAKDVDATPPKVCTLVVTARVAGQMPQTNEISILVLPAIFETIVWGGFSGTLPVGGNSAIPTAPTGAGVAGATISYALKGGSETNCDLVDGSTGEVRAKVVALTTPKVCTLIGTASKRHYTSVNSGDIGINLSPGVQGAVNWGSFAGTLAIGGASRRPLPPTGQAAGAAISYTLSTPTNCTLVNDATGEVRAREVDITSPKTCTIVGRATLTGFADISSGNISIDLGVGTLGAIVWGDFGSDTLQVAGVSRTPGNPTGAGVSGAAITYQLKSGSETNCELVSETTGEVRAKVVNLGSTKTCTLIGTARRTGYSNKVSGDITIELSPGTMGSLTAPVYSGSTLGLGGTLSVITPPSGAPQGATWTYSVVGKRNSAVQAGVCTIVSTSGELSAGASAQNGDICEVTATASATGYTTKSAAVVSITLSNDKALAINWSGYSPSTLTWTSGGVSAPTLASPTITTDSGATTVTTGISTTYTVGSGTTNNSCRVSGAGALTIAGAGLCQVVLSVADNAPGDGINYLANQATASVTVAKGSQSLTVGSNPYGSSPSLTVGDTPLAISHAPTGAETGLAYTSGDSAICTVDNSGRITPLTAGSCVIKARATASANFEASSEVTVATISVAEGTIQVAGADAAAKWGTYGAVKVGATTVAATLGSITPGDAQKSYRSTTDSTCSVDEGSGAVTGMLDGTCGIELTLSRTGYGDLSYSYSISVAQGTWGTVTWAGYEGGNQHTYGDPLPALIPPVSTPQADSWSYSDDRDDYYNGVGKCMADPQTGALTVNLDGNCVITATPSKAGYPAHPGVSQTFTVGRGTFASSSWEGYTDVGHGPNQVRLGGSLPGLLEPTTDPSHSSLFWRYISWDEDICTVDFVSGGVTSLVSVGSCRLRAFSQGGGYTQVQLGVTLTVLPAEPQWGAAWNPGVLSFAASAGSATLDGVTGVDGSAVVTYSVVSAGGTNCSFGTSTSSALSFDTAGTCRVKATVTRSGYATWNSPEIDIEITGQSPVVITWNGYPNANTVALGGGVVNPQTATFEPSGAMGTYSSLTTSICTVTNAGVLTPVAAGTCYVELTATSTGRGAGQVVVPVTVPGSLDFSRVGIPSYGGTGFVSGREVGHLTSADNDGTPVTWSFAASGTRSGSTQAGVCTVDNNSSNSTFGDVVRGASAAVGDICTITVTATPTVPGFTPYSEDITLTVELGTLSFSSVGAPAYGAATITTGLEMGTIPGADDNGASVTWSFAAAGSRNGSTQAGVCTVDNNSGGTTFGDVTLEASALSGDLCTVTATATAMASGYTDHVETIVLTAVLGSLSFSSVGAPAYGATSFRAGLEIGTIPAADDNEVSVTWSFAAAGSRNGSTQAGVCTVDNNSGGTTFGDVTLGSSAQDGDVCTVTATATTSGYERYHETIELTVAFGRLSFSSVGAPAYGASSFSTGLEIGAIPAADDNNVSVTWSFATAGTRSGSSQAGVCTVDNNSQSATFGDITLGSSAENGDVCTVTATATTTAVGYFNYVETIELTVALESLSFSSVGAPAYGGTTLSTGLEVGAIPAVDDNGIAVSWSFSAVGTRSGSEEEGVCQVDEDPDSATFGDVEYGLYARNGDTCTITAIATSTTLGYFDHSETMVLTLALQTLDFSVAGTPAYGGTSLHQTLEVGGSIPAEDDNEVAVSWRFTVVGSEGGNDKMDVCQVDNDPTSTTFGDVSRSANADGGDVCTVTIMAVAAGFESHWEDVELTLTVINPVPVEVFGSRHSYCVHFDNKRVKCWGQNANGQLGIGSTGGDDAKLGDQANEMGANLPYLDFHSTRQVTQVTVGQTHSCALLGDGTVRCWGDGRYNMGYGAGTNSNAPLESAIVLGGLVDKVEAGFSHTCAILAGGTLKCWGRNNHAQTGADYRFGYVGPTGVNLGTNMVATDVAAGGYHTCVMVEDSTVENGNVGVKCWGHDDQGQLGDGTLRADRKSPASVTLGANMSALQIAAGGWHTCAVLEDTSQGSDNTSVKCWGHNDKGQVGDGTSGTDRASPQAVSLGSTSLVRQLALGYKQSCVVFEDNVLKCWGHNHKGQIGTGNTTNQKTPVAVDVGSSLGVKYVGIGEGHACAVLTDNTVKCWGEHANGALGAGAGTIIWGDGASEMGDDLPTVPLW